MEIGRRDTRSKTDIYYVVVDEINSRSWKKFARKMLKLPDSEIDDIESDNRFDIREQKYQMLIKWEKKLENNTTDLLLRMVREFHQQMRKSPSAETIPKKPLFPNQDQSDSTPEHPNVPRPKKKIDKQLSQYRHMLLEISDMIDEASLTKMHRIFLGQANRNFENAFALFSHLDDQDMWEVSTCHGKMEIIKENLKMMGCTDIVTKIDERFSKTFSSPVSGPNTSVQNDASQFTGVASGAESGEYPTKAEPFVNHRNTQGSHTGSFEGTETFGATPGPFPTEKFDSGFVNNNFTIQGSNIQGRFIGCGEVTINKTITSGSAEHTQFSWTGDSDSD